MLGCGKDVLGALDKMLIGDVIFLVALSLSVRPTTQSVVDIGPWSNLNLPNLENYALVNVIGN